MMKIPFAGSNLNNCQCRAAGLPGPDPGPDRRGFSRSESRRGPPAPAAAEPPRLSSGSPASATGDSDSEACCTEVAALCGCTEPQVGTYCQLYALPGLDCNESEARADFKFIPL